MYPLHLASYVIHELNSIPLFILESNTILISLFKPPFQLLPSHRMIAYPFETLVPSYIALNEFTEIQLVGYLVYFPLSSPSDAQLCGDAFFRSFFSLGRIHRTMEILEKGWGLDHGDLKHRNEEINERDQPLRKGSQDREDTLGFSLPAPSPLLHRLNLGTRFLVVEENCDARIIKLQ